MSRRSRRRRVRGGSGWLGKVVLGLIVSGVVAAGVLYFVVRGYLHSDAFRRFLAQKVGEAAHVSGEFTPFRWEGLAVDTAAFEASGDGIVKGVRLEGLHTEVGVSGLRRGVWEIKGAQVQRLEVSLDARNHGGRETPPAVEKRPAARADGPGWLPREVALRGLDVREVVVRALLEQGPVDVAGMRVRVEPGSAKNAYRAKISDGTIRLPFALLPEIRLDEADFRYQDGRVGLNRATAAGWTDGRLDASGEWDAASGQYALEGNVSGVKCEDLFNEDWSKRFVGDVSSDFTLDNQGASPVARGRLTVRNGTLTALPVLDALAAYADTRRFRVLALSEAHTDWRWQDGGLFLSNLVLASEGLVRLEGAISIRGRELDGTFRLGLAAGTLATIPGAETDVFTPGERGLLWTPLRITGTLDDPKEDLTDRLIEAAGLRMFDVIPETGEKVIRFSRSLLGESPSQTIDQGVKIIERGAGIVDGMGQVIDGFFDRGKPKEPDPPKKDP